MSHSSFLCFWLPMLSELACSPYFPKKQSLLMLSPLDSFLTCTNAHILKAVEVCGCISVSSQSSEPVFLRTCPGSYFPTPSMHIGKDCELFLLVHPSFRAAWGFSGSFSSYWFCPWLCSQLRDRQRREHVGKLTVWVLARLLFFFFPLFVYFSLLKSFCPFMT